MNDVKLVSANNGDRSQDTESFGEEQWLEGHKKEIWAHSLSIYYQACGSRVHSLWENLLSWVFWCVHFSACMLYSRILFFKEGTMLDRIKNYLNIL